MEMFRWTVYLAVPFVFYKVANAENLRWFVQTAGIGKIYDGVNKEVEDIENLREETKLERAQRSRERDERLRRKLEERAAKVKDN